MDDDDIETSSFRSSTLKEAAIWIVPCTSHFSIARRPVSGTDSNHLFLAHHLHDVELGPLMPPPFRNPAPDRREVCWVNTTYGDGALLGMVYDGTALFIILYPVVVGRVGSPDELKVVLQPCITQIETGQVMPKKSCWQSQSGARWTGSPILMAH